MHAAFASWQGANAVPSNLKRDFHGSREPPFVARNSFFTFHFVASDIFGRSWPFGDSRFGRRLETTSTEGFAVSPKTLDVPRSLLGCHVGEMAPPGDFAHSAPLSRPAFIAYIEAAMHCRSYYYFSFFTSNFSLSLVHLSRAFREAFAREKRGGCAALGVGAEIFSHLFLIRLFFLLKKTSVLHGNTPSVSKFSVCSEMYKTSGRKFPPCSNIARLRHLSALLRLWTLWSCFFLWQMRERRLSRQRNRMGRKREKRASMTDFYRWVWRLDGVLAKGPPFGVVGGPI